MEVLLVRGRFHWGFSVKYPLQSAAQFSLLAPPPTALLGALAYGCNDGVETSEDGRSAAAKLLKYVRWAAFGFDEHIHGLRLRLLAVADMTRNIAAPYVREAEQALFSVQAMGKVYVAGMRVKLAYFGEGLSGLMRCGWQITRIGSKESLFEPAEVELLKAESTGAKRFATSLYVRADVAKPLDPTKVAELEVWPLAEEPFYLWKGRPKEVVKLYLPARFEEVEYEGENVVKFGEELYAVP
jgi:CRISPR-associated protein Cas5, Apern subtype